jgi:hypothetical protein
MWAKTQAATIGHGDRRPSGMFWIPSQWCKSPIDVGMIINMAHLQLIYR